MKDARFCQFWRDKSLAEGCVRGSKDERGHSERNKEAQAP